MVIIEGVRGTFCGDYNVIYNSVKQVQELTLRYNNKTGRKKLRREIKTNRNLADNYISDFDLVNGTIGLKDDQYKCFKYIEHFYKKYNFKEAKK